MNILFTCIGRRVELVQCFREAAQKNNIELNIYGTDIDYTVIALSFCDKKFIVPRVDDETFVPVLMDICEKESVTALIPTVDDDLLLLAEHKNEFLKKGTKVFISGFEEIAMCRDKRKTSSFFEKCGVKYPLTFDDIDAYTLGYPCFIKPKDGGSSLYAYKVENETELKTYVKQVPDYIIQPFIDGTEYSIDVLCDFDGNPIYITPRVRLAVRSGEVLKTKIVQEKSIVNEINKIVAEMKPCGPITIQLIKDSKTGDNFYIEINPRFGGGAPLSMKAGADEAGAILKMLNNEKVEYKENAAQDGAIFCRYDQSVRMA